MDCARIITEAKAERDELSARIEKLDALIASAIDLAGGGPALVPVAPRPTRAPASQRAGGLMGPTRDAVAKILRGRGKPLGTAQLVPLVQAEGVEVGGKSSVATLSARLSNGEEFTNNRGIGWWFTGEEIPNQTATIFDEVEGNTQEGKPSTSTLY